MPNCKHCGAALPSYDVALTDIIGQEHAKRAAEVAVAGRHSIVFIGNHDAEAIASWCARHGTTAYAVKPCPCGYFGHPTQECICSLSMVGKWMRRKDYLTAMEADIHVEMAPTDSAAIERWTAGRRGEPDEIVLDRVAKIGPRPPLELGEAGRSLLRGAARQLNLDGYRCRRMLEVAATIATLSRSERIETHHLAEAIQYRPRRK